MKRSLVFVSIVIIILALSSCTTSHSSSIKVNYLAGEGGTIVGNASQELEATDDTVTFSEVTATPLEGYKFIGWSDGYSEPTRTDTLSKNATFTALFTKLHTIRFTTDYSRGFIFGSCTQYVKNGEQTAEVSAFPMTGYKFSHWSNGSTDESLVITATDSVEIEAFFEKDSLSLPILSIDTENGDAITSKNTYLDCVISVENTDEDYLIDATNAKIRGRGNTTWEGYDKKPYKLKLDYKTDLLGLGRARDFVLLPNHSDLSLSRNYLAQSIASLFGSIDMCSNVQFIELYLNGEYIGVYLICEQIELNSSRINLNDGEGVDTSYLIELDGRASGNYITLNGKNYVVKEPDEDLTNEQFAFIEDYLNNCYNALCGNDYDAVLELIDVRSFAEAYIVYELFNCVDVGYASFNIYKEAGSKLYCGPVWDFDRSLGIVGHSKGAKNYDTLWAKQENMWFNALLGFEEFEALVSTILNEKATQIRQKINECFNYLYQSRDSFDRNFERWRILGTFVWPNDDELTELGTWDLQLEYARNYLNNSLDYMLSVYFTENQ